MLKTRLLDTTLSSYESFSSDRSRSENSTTSKFKALRHLSKNKNIVVHRADKGNTIVIIDKISYISAIKEILNDHTKFSNLDIPAGKEIIYITKLENRITSELKLLKMKKLLITLLIKTLNQLGDRSGILYGLRKVHKKTKNGLPSFRPILSPIGTPIYKLEKCLLSFLTSLTENEYAVTGSFYFAEEICKQDPNLYTASLDADSLFTNIPLDKTIDSLC